MPDGSRQRLLGCLSGSGLHNRAALSRSASLASAISDTRLRLGWALPLRPELVPGPGPDGEDPESPRLAAGKLDLHLVPGRAPHERLADR